MPNDSYIHLKKENKDLVSGGECDSGAGEVPVGEVCGGEGEQLPELYTTADLAAVLLEHNKLLGRLQQFTAPGTTAPTSRSPI